MDRASRTLRGIFNNGSPRARGSVGASEIVQQVLDGYALECYRARTRSSASVAARSAMNYMRAAEQKSCIHEPRLNTDE